MEISLLVKESECRQQRVIFLLFKHWAFVRGMVSYYRSLFLLWLKTGPWLYLGKGHMVFLRFPVHMKSRHGGLRSHEIELRVELWLSVHV